MFTLFKKKPLLKDLIPNDAVDFHSHIVYGLDDGAQTLDDTIFLIESMKSFGYTKLIATPHTTAFVWENSKEQILSQYEKVKSEIDTDICLNVASEYMMDDYFLQKLDNESLLTIKDNYVLVEMSYMNPPINLFEILFKLSIKGYQIILAHPERYNFYHYDIENYKKLKDVGCFFQLNLLATTGYYGNNVLKACELLLKNNMYDFACSDVHHQKHINGFSSKVEVKNPEIITNLLEKNKIFR